jgi:hypothetical protein
VNLSKKRHKAKNTNKVVWISACGNGHLCPMNTLSRFLNKIATGPTLIVLLLAYISFPAYWLKNAEETINRLAGRPIGPIDLTFGFNPTQTLQMVADYGPEVRAFYTRTELTLDVIYPLVYTLLFAVVLTMLFRNRPYKPFAGVELLPLVTLVFDFLENATIVGLLTTYPAQSMTLAVLCEIFKLAKWISAGVVMLLVLYGLIRRIR